jgi:hypothetical protein
MIFLRAIPCLAVSPRHSFSAKMGAFAKEDARCVDRISMKITEDLRKYAADQGVSEQEALQEGMEEKSREFAEKGSELYAKA